MAYIYKITNDINDKIYIGKTEFDIQKRWREHCNDYNRERCEKRPLYNAMRKYGVEHFSIFLIEETDAPETREAYWISFYDSYRNGYNATMGGDGKKYLDYEEIFGVYQRTLDLQETSRLCCVSWTSVRNIVRAMGIEIDDSHDVIKKKYSKVVCMYDKNDHNKLIMTFPSTTEAAKYLVNNRYTKTKDAKNITSKIAAVCNKKRASALGFYWQYNEYDQDDDMRVIHKSKILCIEQYDMNDNLLRVFNNYDEAAQYLISNGSLSKREYLIKSICRVVNGHLKSSAGYRWKAKYK